MINKVYKVVEDKFLVNNNKKFPLRPTSEINPKIKQRKRRK